jgi:hypothetical protein
MEIIGVRGFESLQVHYIENQQVMEIKIENITWSFKSLNHYDEKSLGLSYVGIPFNMLKRFIKETCWDKDLKVPPHYYEEDLDLLHSGCEHDCYNTDTQIVLMNWLHDKKRQYRLDYRGEDPFWIFHDFCHSQGDVYSYEVSGINSWVEHYRILEGAEMAKHDGIYMKPETAIGIYNAWTNRFNFREGSNMTVMHFSELESCMKDSESLELLHFLNETT